MQDHYLELRVLWLPSPRLKDIALQDDTSKSIMRWLCFSFFLVIDFFEFVSKKGKKKILSRVSNIDPDHFV